MMYPRWWLACVVMLVCVAAPVASLTQDIRLDSVLLDWTSHPDEAETTVCFHNEGVNARPDPAQYELVITNGQGRRWRQREASTLANHRQGRRWRRREASTLANHRWCFPGVTLTRPDLSKTLRASVTMKDASLKTEIAREDIEIFPIVPWVDGVVVSWRNPGGHTFTVRREGDPGPLATSLTCDSCTYTVIPQEAETVVTMDTEAETVVTKETEAETVVTIETEDSSPVHQLARLHTSSQDDSLELLEIHQVLRDGQPLGTDHNLRLTILPLHDIQMVQEWVLTLYTGNEQIHYSTTINQTTYTNNTPAEIEFECNLIDSQIIVLRAKNDTNENIVFYFISVSIKDLGTRVAWVSGEGDLRYLRVEAGTLDQVAVGDRHQCSREDSPCYFSATDFHGQIPAEIPRCKNLTYDILQCDDIIATSQKMDEVPKLVLLQEEKALEATYSSNAASVEVVVTNWTDNSVFPSNSKFECMFVDTNRCRAVITHGLEEKRVNSMVVLLNENGYVTQSIIVPFEVYKVSAQPLLQDALQVTWDDATSGTYQVSISSSPHLPAESHVTVNCSIDGGQADASCQAHLVRLTLAGNSSVSVQKCSETNAVLTTALMDELLPPAGEVTRVTRVTRVDDHTPVTRVVLASTEPNIHNVALVRIVKDAEDSCNFTEDYYEGNVNYITNDYLFEFPVDILQSMASVDFLVLGYLDNRTIGVVGAAYLTLNVLEEKVVWVGAETKNSSASVRLDLDPHDNFINGSRVCLEGASSCYYLEVGGEQALDNVQRCEKVNNTAPGGPPQVYQCDTSTTPFTELAPVAEVKVVGGSLLVTLGASLTTDSVEVIAYDPSDLTKVYSDPATPCISEGQDTECTQPIKGAQERQVVSVLVVLVDKTGTVQGSTLLQASVPAESSTKAWVIVVSVLGSVFGVAIIASIVMIIMKKKQLAKTEGGLRVSHDEIIHGSPVSTSDSSPMEGRSQAASIHPFGSSSNSQPRNNEFASDLDNFPQVSLNPKGSPSGSSHHYEFSPSTSNQDMTRF